MKGRVHATRKDIRDSINANPGRFGLSIATISIGVFSLSILISVLNGLEKQSEAVIQNLGVNVIGILARDRRPSYLGALEKRHAAYLANALPDATVTSLKAYDVNTLGTNQTIKVLMTDHHLRSVRQWKMHSGRFLDAGDLLFRERNVVISRRVAESWNWKVHDVIVLGSLAFKVVGVVEIGAAALDTELGNADLSLGERVALIPNTLEPYWLDQRERPDSGIDGIFVHVKDATKFDSTLRRANRLLTHPDQRVGAVSWVTPETLISGLKKLRDTLAISVGSIAIISLLLGGTTLMSLMAANVRDRISEIGLRRSLGATERDIVTLFLAEALVITVIAGLLGSILAQSILLLGKGFLPVPLSIDGQSILVPIFASVFFGIGFSYRPAKAASQINPAQALRD